MAWVAGGLLFLLLPLATQAAAPAATPRQQKMLDALQDSSELAQAWGEPRAVLSVMEDSLRRWALLRRCLPRSTDTRLFMPAYRRYVETVGGAFYRYLREPAGVGARLQGHKQDLWAIDQLSDEQYARSLWMLTSVEMAWIRKIDDLGWALDMLLDEMTDVSTGLGNVALLTAFKQVLVRTGQLEPVLVALGKADPSLPEAFMSLELPWPVPAEKWEHWQDLARRLQAHGDRIREAYWNSWPKRVRMQLDIYQDDPLFLFQERARTAEEAWVSRKAKSRDGEPDAAALTDTERLGRRIFFYFGEPASKEPDPDLLKAYEWLRQRSQAYVDTNKAQICGSP